MSKTKDEKFMISLYEAALSAGDIESPQDKYTVGKNCGLNPKAVDAICKLLTQANFIRKEDEESIYLTPHGRKLAERLLGE
jgi:predicted transcriptional regulator